MIVVHDDWLLSEKGQTDAARHQQKIDQYIRDNIHNVVSETSIITTNEKKTRISVKGLKDYRFMFGRDGDSVVGGIGQGEGDAGDVIEHVPGQNGDGADGGTAGQGSGNDLMETEIDIDYLVDIMMNDLGLPYIDEKTKKQDLVPAGYKFDSISKIGIQPRLHRKKTIRETIKRTLSLIGMIEDETNCSWEDASRSLSQAQGDINDALAIVNNNTIDSSVDPDDLYIEDDDLRFKQIEDAYEYHSNAVVIAMIDTSYSMGSTKKYLARSMLFWLNEFLKKNYENVKIRFITHTTDAKLVDEDEFFKKGESGGTNCYTAFDMACNLIDTEYPVDEWNVYCVYLSDGEDWSPNKTMESIKKLLDKKINMLSYCETQPNLDNGITGGFMEYQVPLLDIIADTFDFDRRVERGNTFYKNDKLRLLACRIKGKGDIYYALKHMLFGKK